MHSSKSQTLTRLTWSINVKYWVASTPAGGEQGKEELSLLEWVLNWVAYPSHPSPSVPGVTSSGLSHIASEHGNPFMCTDIRFFNVDGVVLVA